jgi:hypothetical protein
MDMQENIDGCIDTETTYSQLAKVDMAFDMSGPVKFVDSIYSLGKASGGVLGSLTQCSSLMEDSVQKANGVASAVFSLMNPV